ncbi:MAG: protein kinase [Polyangiaceae bacterium]
MGRERSRSPDFGIAKARSNFDDGETTAVRELKGKYSYMSLEQARGETVDARSDLFSLGVVLYETLSGPIRFARRLRSKRFEERRQVNIHRSSWCDPIRRPRSFR